MGVGRSKFEDTIIKIIKSEGQKEKRMKKSEQNPKDLKDIIN